MLAACGKEPEPEVVPDTPPEGMYIADTVHYDSQGVTAYNIVYTSVDPYGHPVMLSAAILLDDEVVQSKHSRGYFLYNHFSIFRADECPTRNGNAVEQRLAKGGLITVSADNYGFGITEQQNQAYGMSAINAQASVDALLAAKELLAWEGYTWDDNLFVGGYSQGGQTTVGVLRLVAQRYPDLHITYTFAGAGPYDIPATYCDMVSNDIAGQPSTVVNVLLSYNQYCNLGIQRSELFTEPLLSHIDEWVLSKNYSRTEIDNLMGGLTVSQFVTPALMDFESDLSHRIISTLDNDNLCKGWTPRAGEHIMLFHNTRDITVPPSNTEHLYAFLQQNNIEVDLLMGDYGATDNIDGHNIGAILFTVAAINKVATILGIEPWSIL